MGLKTKKIFLPDEDDRLKLILGLTVLYPVTVGCFFVLFLFWILPLILSPGGASTPLVMSPGYWLHGYWLLAALVWVLLLAILLPLMGPLDKKDLPVKAAAASYRRESGVSIKEETELTPLKRSEINGKDAGKMLAGGGALVAGGGALAAYQSVSLSDDGSGGSTASSRKSSTDRLLIGDSHDGILSAPQTASQLDLDVQCADSLTRSATSTSERKKLTQSGEFLSDCLGSMKSEDDIEGEIIRGNTDCQVHSRDAQEEDEMKPLVVTTDRSSCEEELIERVSRDKPESRYAEYEKAEQLATSQEPQQNENVQETPISPTVDQTNIVVNSSEKEQEPIDTTQEDLQKTADLTQEEQEKTADTTQEEQEEGVVEDTIEPVMRRKSKALPSIDTSRASQVHCSAPSTMSPRESNVVFLYVNTEDEK